MKYFRLANADFRDSVDLTRYEDDIFQAVQKVKPDTKVTVTPNYFTTTPELGKMESILVSKQLRMGGLKEYTLYRPCLFNSYRQSVLYKSYTVFPFLTITKLSKFFELFYVFL